MSATKPSTVTRSGGRRRSLRIELVDPVATAPAWLRAVVILIGLLAGGAFLGVQTGLGTGLWGTVSDATVGSPLGIGQVIQLATPLILAGCAVAIALRLGLWNIGVEGQIVMGAWLATGLAYAVPGLPGPLLVVAMLAAGFAGGALWALVPALARAYMGISEVVTTLMLNFVAALWMVYWATGPWADRGLQGIGSVSTRAVTRSVWLPQYEIGDVTVGLGFFLALAVALLLWAAFRWTPLGVTSALAGADERTARYAGVDVARVRAGVFLLSGGVGGLVGVIVELDQIHSLSSQLSNNTGYVGIVVAVLGAGSMALAIPLGALMAFIAAAGVSLQIAGVSAYAVLLLTGLLLVLAACADAISRYRLRADEPPHAVPPAGDPAAGDRDPTDSKEALA